MSGRSRNRVARLEYGIDAFGPQDLCDRCGGTGGVYPADGEHAAWATRERMRRVLADLGPDVLCEGEVLPEPEPEPREAKRPCGWCRGTGLVSVYRKTRMAAAAGGYQSVTDMLNAAMYGLR